MSQKHYVMIPLAPWGHSRPEIILALRLLRLHPHLVITLFTRADGLGKAISLISAFNLDFSQSDRLRIVAYPLLGPPPANPLSTTEDNAATWQLAHWVGDTVLPVLKRFLQACHPPEQPPHARQPDVYIVDRLICLLPKLRQQGIPIPKYLSLLPMSLPFAGSILKRSPPFDTVIQQYMASVESGTDDAEAFEKTVGANHELFESSSGLGPMYIHEMDPNDTADFGDQLIVIWPACFSPNPKDGLMTIGPQLGEPKIEHDQDVIRFLDRQAPKSVVYISFGSYSWIPSLQQSILLFDTIRKLGLGVLVVNALNPILGAPRTDILEVVNDRLGKTQGRGLLVDWAPQNEVLLHPAVAFMLTHGGSNSAQECMVSAMPMVVWPGGWDQPHVASEVCQLGIARELVQVRTGHNIGRETARGILVEGTDEAIALEMEEVFRFMVSEQAERMMKRCEEVRELVKEDMERGDSHKNMLALGAL